jgi:hypothetical protein
VSRVIHGWVMHSLLGASPPRPSTQLRAPGSVPDFAEATAGLAEA